MSEPADGNTEETATEDVPANLEGLPTVAAQMMQALEAGLYMPALVVALTLPDIMGALGSENGRATGPKYKAWLTEFAGYPPDDAQALWDIRCSLLHQGRANAGEIKTGFTVPGTGQLHKLSVEAHDGVTVAWYSMETFIEDLARAVTEWLRRYGLTAQAQRNLERFARLRPDAPRRSVGDSRHSLRLAGLVQSGTQMARNGLSDLETPQQSRRVSA